MNQSTQNNYVFKEQQIAEFSSLFDTFRKIHERLIREGYTIQEGKLIPPQKAEVKPVV